MNSVFYSFGATLVISLASFIGILGILLKAKILDKVLLWLVGFSAGALMGGAFLHLIPEAVEEEFSELFFVYILLGFVVFFILEKFLLWHHCHKHGKTQSECDTKTFGYMNLVGDGFHNFIDGLLIAASFSVDVGLGVATSLAVLAHEIPQEIGDFGVLVYSGFSKTKALLFNFFTALLAMVGALVGIFLANALDSFTFLLIAVTAGGFIYIAASDLVPEIHKEHKAKNSLMSLGFFLVGIVFMYWIKMIFE